jgi:hypothetical protein
MKVRPDGSQEYGAAEQLEKMTNRTTKKFIREAAAQNAENARRLARYDEAIRLLRLAKFEKEHWHEADAFLAAEPKEGEGGR